jgi:hypothetical protein
MYVSTGEDRERIVKTCCYRDGYKVCARRRRKFGERFSLRECFWFLFTYVDKISSIS